MRFDTGIPGFLENSDLLVSLWKMCKKNVPMVMMDYMFANVDKHSRHPKDWAFTATRNTGSRPPICMKQFWTLARNQQHLSYIPRGGGVNRCYAALMEQRHVAGDPVCQDIPKHLQGIRRLEAVQLEGPQPQARMTLGDEVRIAEEHLQRLVDKKNAQEQWFKNSPDYVSMLGQRLVEETQRCFFTFQRELNVETLGYELQGAWCTILHEQFEKEDPDLLYYLFMMWGQDNLPAVYGEWEDGEAEQVAEEAYSEIVMEAPCYDLTMQIVKAESHLQRLAQQQAELAVPHRPAKFGPRVQYGPRKKVRKAWRLYVDDDGWARGWQNYVIKDYGATPMHGRDAAVLLSVAHVFWTQTQYRFACSAGGDDGELAVFSACVVVRHGD